MATPDAPQFFSRADFHLNAAWLGTATISPDRTKSAEAQRFAWDTFWGGAVDIVDFVSGRVTGVVDYEAVLGSEFQPFDPNQGNYTLEASVSRRFGARTEVAAMLHHVSRHLSDREKTHLGIAYNELGGRLLRRMEKDGRMLDVSVDLGRTLEHAFVDYTWLANAELLARAPLSPHLGVFAHAAGHLIGVDGSVPDRTTQSGGLIEAGIHIGRRGGALELFAGFEKRVDAYPLARDPEHWFLAGFRLLSR